jgi:hypothetical protein
MTKPSKRKLIKYYKKLNKKYKTTDNEMVRIITLKEKSRIKEKLLNSGVDISKLNKFDEKSKIL